MGKGTKYISLTNYLIKSGKDEITLTFQELEKITGGLPKSVYKYKHAWTDSSQHSFSYGWINAGYSIRGDFDNSRATFIKLMEYNTNKKVFDNFERTKKFPYISEITSDYQSDLNLIEILNKLSSEARNLFHSEADFQFRLAWEIKELYRDRVDVILEYPVETLRGRVYIDIMVILDGHKYIPIELKYKTISANFIIGNNSLRLLNQGAQDLGKFDYLNDIERIESYKKKYPMTEGYAVLLTNDLLYTKKTRRNTKNKDFSIGNKEVKNNVLTWREDSSVFINKHRKASINLSGRYTMKWLTYNTFKDIYNNEVDFYILITKI